MDDQIIDAIAGETTIQVTYQGNPREIIPLAYGKLKNGRDALLCYKVNTYVDGDIDFSIRLYHCHKMKIISTEGKSVPFNRKIDYYLTKHFKEFYAKIETK